MTDGYWRREQHQPIHEMAVNENIKEMIVVGIGYPDSYNPNEVRKRDLISGADKFLSFILQELIPFIEGNYRTSDERTLWGSSFGGYFAIYTLFQCADSTKDVFKNYIVASAAAFQTTKYNGKDLNLFDYEKMFYEKTKELKVNLYLTVGGIEEVYFTDSFNELVRVLKERNYKDFFMKSYVDPGKDHFTVWEPTFYEGIRLFLKK
jgi:predicted alpha/beta superfamily hydrolase